MVYTRVGVIGLHKLTVYVDRNYVSRASPRRRRRVQICVFTRLWDLQVSSLEPLQLYFVAQHKASSVWGRVLSITDREGRIKHIQFGYVCLCSTSKIIVHIFFFQRHSEINRLIFLFFSGYQHILYLLVNIVNRNLFKNIFFEE